MSCCCDDSVFSSIKIDTVAPDFHLSAYDPLKEDETHVSLNDLRGKWVVLFYYPADFTFVCPTELRDMANAQSQFHELDVTVLAASTDTVFSHRAWVQHE